MVYGLASLFAGMSLAEELHTICFTVFVIVGTVCCSWAPRIRVSFKPCPRQNRLTPIAKMFRSERAPRYCSHGVVTLNEIWPILMLV
jgi:hypothetical protein